MWLISTTLQRDQLLQLERVGDKSADNLLAAIEQSKHNSLERLLFALGIRFVGQKGAESLARHFGSLERLQAADEAALRSVPDVGEKMAESIISYFAAASSQQLIEKLRAAGVNLQHQGAAVAEDLLQGKVFVVTGKLPGLSREEAHDLIERYGGNVAGSVSKKTDYLLAGEKAGSKLARGATAGCPGNLAG
jgi:DNA ligase (NAD+)